MHSLNKILYIEDEPDIHAIAKIAIEMIGGYTLHPCLSGNEALQYAEEFSPDLILLDVMMPEIDGPTTLLKLWEIESLINTPAIFMTAKAQANEIAEYKALGALDVIAKPFDPMTLSNQIKVIWDSTNG